MSKIKAWKVSYFDPHIHTTILGNEWRNHSTVLFYSKENAIKFAENKPDAKIEQITLPKEHDYYINK